ncbi:protein TolR [Sphingorhabdus sp. Alg239-R122]|uniref:protein TolR n=1 Tax=Sphingorhabdus sp. Alg239-R122 TaxID=2305989 RepID=UPI0013DBE632|nr:protein TolR [Sphingorhabdus sp. Alg239-R122]
MAMQLPSSGGRRGRGGARAPMSEINVTPFVDVMLVLLIIFMVTAPLLVSGVPVELPETNARPLEQDNDPVQISINSDGFVFVQDEQVADNDLPALLAQIRGNGNNQPQVTLRADRGLDYGRVMQVMGELNRAGLSKVSLVTTSSSGAP